MLTALKSLFEKRQPSVARLSQRRRNSRVAMHRNSFPLTALFPQRQRASRVGITSQPESLEPRLAMTVGAVQSDDTIYIHIDAQNAEPNAYLRATETGDLLVATDNSFFNPTVIDNYQSKPNLAVFSGTSRIDEKLNPSKWWMLDSEEGTPTTGLHLTGDGIFANDDATPRMYAFGILENDTNINFRAIAGNQPGRTTTLPARQFNLGSVDGEVFGSVKYVQFDGNISEWHFSNFNRKAQTYDPSIVEITAGPGVPAHDSLNQNRANQTHSNYYAITSLKEGYIRPTAIRIVDIGKDSPTGRPTANRLLVVEWSGEPSSPPIIAATYPVAQPDVEFTDISRDQQRGVTEATGQVLYRNITKITRAGALSRGVLDYKLSGAYATGIGGGSASLGRQPGFFDTSLNFALTHRFYDQANDPDRAARYPRESTEGDSVLVTTTASVNGANEVFDANQGLLDENTNARGYAASSILLADDNQQLGPSTDKLVRVNATFSDPSDDGREGRWTVATEFLPAIGGPGIGYGDGTLGTQIFQGVNVAAGALPQMVDTKYLTWAKDGVSSLTFSPGPAIQFDDVMIEFTTPGSVLNIESPLIVDEVFDVRATSVRVDAETKVNGMLYAGRSTHLLKRDESSGDLVQLPRLTPRDAYSETPLMAPENWQVRGIEPEFSVVLGNNGSVARLEVGEGSEGYGYDPADPPLITMPAPEPQNAQAEVVNISGSVSSFAVTSGGLGIQNVGPGSFFLLPAAGESSFQMVESITVGGAYDYFNGGAAVQEAAPLIVVDRPDLLEDPARIGNGEAAKARAIWGYGLQDAIPIPTITGTLPWTGADNNPNTQLINITASNPDTGDLWQNPLFNNLVAQKIGSTETQKAQGQTPAAGFTTYRLNAQNVDPGFPGLGYDPAGNYIVTANLLGSSASVSITASDEPKLGIIVEDGGLNYAQNEVVKAYVVTELTAAGASEVAGYEFSATAEEAPGSSFYGANITVGALVSQQTEERDLFEYLAVGMPIRGEGLASDATIAGVDFTNRVISLSEGGLLAAGLLGGVKIYPAEHWVENQPLPENISSLVTRTSLAYDRAKVAYEVGPGGTVLAASIVAPVDENTPLATLKSGRFLGRFGGSGYTALPSIANSLDQNINSAATSPTFVSSLDGKLAEVKVTVAGFNYLTDEPDKRGVLSASVSGGRVAGELSLAVEAGQLTGRGVITNLGSGYQSDTGDVSIPDPDAFKEGAGLPALFRAVVEPDGTIRETVRVQGGDGYFAPPQPFIEPPLTILNGVAVARVDLVSGTITGVDIQNPGSGYTVAPTIVIEAPGPEGVGRRALAVAIIESGKLKEIRVVDPGAGYTSQPSVIVSDLLTPAVVESIEIGSSLEVEGAIELYVADEVQTLDPLRGELVIQQEAELRGGQTIYIESRAADIINEGLLKTPASIQVQMVSTVSEQFAGPFQFTSTGPQSLAADSLYLGFDNQSEGSSSESYQHNVSLETDIDFLRISTNVDGNTGVAAPYQLKVTQDKDLEVDAVLRAGGDIEFQINEGSLGFTSDSAVETERGFAVTAKRVTINRAIQSTAGPIVLTATDEDINVKNSISVVSPLRNELVNDVVLRSNKGKVIVDGDVTALNNILVEAATGLNPLVNADLANLEPEQGNYLAENVLTNLGLFSTDGTLSVTSEDGDVNVLTAVSEAVVVSTKEGIDGTLTGVVRIIEKDNFEFDIRAGKVDIVAMGGDPGVYGTNDRALEGMLRGVSLAGLSAPEGSIDVRSDIATTFRVDNWYGLDSAGNALDGNYTAATEKAGLLAAGDVRIVALAEEVVVADVPLAGGNAREVRFATVAALPEGVLYDPGTAGFISGQLEGEGSILGARGIEGMNEVHGSNHFDVGDLILVRNQEGEDSEQNGIYRIDRMGGGALGYEHWRLVRDATASSEALLPNGTYVRVLEGTGQGIYQVSYTPAKKRVVNVSKGSRFTTDAAGLLGVELGDGVQGEGIVPTAEVAGIDWENRVITLGLPAGVEVEAIHPSDLLALVNLPELLEKYDPGKRYIGLRLSPDAGSISAGAVHPLVQAAKTSLAKGENVLVSNRRTRGVDPEALSAGAKVIAASGNVLVLSPESAGENWTDYERVEGKAFTVVVGFASQATDGRTLNPSVRSQLLDLPIERINGNEILVKDSFYRWDIVVPGQRVTGDGLKPSAEIVSVSRNSRTIVLSDGAVPSAFPIEAEIDTSQTPHNIDFSKYELIFVSMDSLAEDAFGKLEPGMLVTGPGLSVNTVIVAADKATGVIAVPAGSILAWGSDDAPDVPRVNILDPASGTRPLGLDGVAVTAVTQASAEPELADTIVLGTDAGFSDLDFDRLRIGMAVSGDGIRPGALLISIDPGNRVIGISPGSITGSVNAVTFHSPVFDVLAALETGQLSLDTDGGKSLEVLVAEGWVEVSITAPVLGARTSSSNIGTFNEERYRVVTTVNEQVKVDGLVEEAKARFLDDTDAGEWQSNVVLGQDVTTDLLKFERTELELAESESLKEVIVSDRSSLGGVPSYARDGTGTRVTAIVQSELGLYLRRYEHVRATDEFVAQQISFQRLLDDEGLLNALEAGGGISVKVLSEAEFVIVYQAYQDGQPTGDWIEILVDGVNSLFNLAVSQSSRNGVEQGSIHVFKGASSVYLSPAEGYSYSAGAYDSTNDRYFVGYVHEDEYHLGVLDNSGQTLDSVAAFGEGVMAMAITVENNGGSVVVATAKEDLNGVPEATVTFVDFNTGNVEAVKTVALGKGEPRFISSTGDGSFLFGLGDYGLAFVEMNDEMPRHVVTYDLSESIDLVTPAGELDAWHSLLFVDKEGTFTSANVPSVFSRELPRSQVAGLDYRAGIVSMTAGAIGIGDDRAIVRVGDVRYAIAPNAKTYFFTEALVEPRVIRYDDGNGQVDSGSSIEFQKGRFDNGYVLISDILSVPSVDPLNDVGSVWKSLNDLLPDDNDAIGDGPYVYAKDVAGQWIYFGQLEGIDSYNGIIGLRPADASSSTPVLSALREITSGTGVPEIMVAPQRDDVELVDESFARRTVAWNGSEGARTVDWRGNELLFTIQSQRPTDTLATESALFDGSSSDYAVTLAESFFENSAVKPGMVVTGDGIQSGTVVSAVDALNNIVWISQKRLLDGLGENPAGRRVQFSYATERSSGLQVAERLGASNVSENVSLMHDFSEGRLVLSIDEIETQLARLNLPGSNQLQQLVVGATVLPNYQGGIGSGGVATGVDWRTGLIGVSGGVIVDTQIIETPFSHLVEFEDAYALKTGGSQPRYAFDAVRANAGIVGQRGGFVISVEDKDGGGIAKWSAIGLGGAVYAEFESDTQTGGSRDLALIGKIQGYDYQAGLLYLSGVTTEGKNRLTSFKAETAPRLVVLGVGLGHSVETEAVDLRFDPADPDYTRFGTSPDGALVIVRVREVQESFSSSQRNTRLGMSDVDQRVGSQNWLTIAADSGLARTIDGDRVATDSITLLDLERLAAKDLVGDGIAKGSKVDAVGITVQEVGGQLVPRVLLDSNFGVSSGQKATEVIASAPIFLQNVNSGLVEGDFVRNDINADLIAVDGYGYFAELVLAMREDKTVTVSMSPSNIPDSVTGRWLKDNSGVIGIDTENQLIALEAGSVLTNGVSTVRFFIDGRRAELSASGYVEEAGTNAFVNGFLPDATVMRSLAGSDQTGTFSAANAVMVRFQEDGVEEGDFNKRRFSSFQELSVDGLTELYLVETDSTPQRIGVVVGVDAMTNLVAVEADSEAAATQLSSEVSSEVESGREVQLRFKVDGVWLVSDVGGSEIKPAVVKSVSASGDWVPGSIFETTEDKVVSRLVISDDEPFDLNIFRLGDIVLDEENCIIEPVERAGGLYAARIVGIDPKNRVLAVAATLPNNNDGQFEIVPATPPIIDSLRLQRITIKTATRQELESPLVIDLAVRGGRGMVAGRLEGDFVRVLPDEALGGNLVGQRIEGLEGSSFGVGAEIIGSAVSMGLVAVTPGAVVSRDTGNLETYAFKVNIGAWSEGGVSSASGNGLTPNSLFDNSRIIIEKDSRTRELSGLNLWAAAYVGQRFVGNVTGYDSSLGLLGVREAAPEPLRSGETLDIELGQFQQLGGYTLESSSVIGDFSGRRLFLPTAALFSPAGNPLAADSLQLGMPIWREGSDALYGYISGRAFVSSAERGDAILLGVTETVQQDNDGAIPVDSSGLGAAEEIRFGGQYTTLGVTGVVAKLFDVTGPMAVANGGDSPSQPFIFNGLSGPRGVVDPALITANRNGLLGASVTGAGVPPGVVITGFDEQLGLLGFSQRISAASGGTNIEITPVDSEYSWNASVSDVTDAFAGNLNATTRFTLSDTVLLPISSEAWIGREVEVSNNQNQQVTARIVGFDVTSRLVAIDAAINSPLRLEFKENTIISQSQDNFAPGSSFVFRDSTTIFVDASVIDGYELDVGDRISIANDSEFNHFRVKGVDRDLGLIVVDDTGLFDTRTAAVLLSSSSPRISHISPAVISYASDADNGSFNHARFMVARENLDQNLDQLDSFFVGQPIAGPGLTDGVVHVITGIDREIGLVGVKVQSGGVSTVTQNTTPRVIDIQTSGDLASIFSSRSTHAAVSSSRSLIPKGQLEIPEEQPDFPIDSVSQAFINVGANFPYTWLAAAFEQVKSYRDGSSDVEQEVEIEGFDSRGNLVFVRRETDAIDSQIVGFDPRLGILQFTKLDPNNTDFDLGSVTRLKVTVSKPVDGGSVTFNPKDLQYEAAVSSASEDINETQKVRPDAGHRIYLSEADLVQIEEQIGQYAYVSGPGLLGVQRITSFGADPSYGTYITLEAGAVNDPSKLTSSQGPLILDSDQDPANAGKVFATVTRLENYVVGTRTQDVVKIKSLPSGAGNIFDRLSIGSQVRGDGITRLGIVRGFDSANGLLYLESGGTASPLRLQGATVTTTFEVVDFRAAAIGSSFGDSIAVATGEEIDLQQFLIGSNVGGSDGVATTAKIVGVDPVAGVVTISPGGVESVNQLGTLRVTRDGTVHSLAVDPTNVSRARVSSQSVSPFAIRIDKSFVQYQRIFVGMENVRGNGLVEGSVKVAAIDAENRVLYLTLESIDNLSDLDVLRFEDSDGVFNAIVERNSDGQPRASYGAGLPASSIIGNLSGDLLSIPDTQLELFRSYGADLIGVDIVGSVLRGPSPVLGFDTATGLIAVPSGSVNKSLALLDSGDRTTISISEGISPIGRKNEDANGREAKLTFENTDFLTKALTTLRAGQSVSGVGINPSAVIVRVTAAKQELVIASRNDKPVLDASLGESLLPRQLRFGRPTYLQLGATTREGSTTVTFASGDFGSIPISIARKAEKAISEVGPASNDENSIGYTQLIARTRSDDRIGRDAIEQDFGLLKRDDIAVGYGLREGEGYRVYRPVYANGQVALQLYSGTIRNVPLSEGMYKVVYQFVDNDGQVETSTFAIAEEGIAGARVGDLVRLVGGVKGNSLVDYVSEEQKQFLGRVRDINRLEREVTIRIEPDPLDLEDTKLTQQREALNTMTSFDVVFGSPFEEGLLANTRMFTAVQFLRESPVVESEIYTEDPQGVTRIVVSSHGATIVNNRTESSLGKMVEAWGKTARTILRSPDQYEEDFLDRFKLQFQAFSDGTDSQEFEIRLGQELPSLVDVPIMIDGGQRYGGVGEGRVVIDGAEITADPFGNPAKTYLNGGTNGIVFASSGAAGVEDVEKRFTGVRDLSMVGFTQGAAIVLDSIDNILIEQNEFGFDPDAIRRANWQGVRISGTSSLNAVLDNAFAGSEDAAVVLTDEATNNFIAGNIIGIAEVGNNDVGVLAESGGNSIGVPIARFSQTKESEVYLYAKERSAEQGERIIEIVSDDFDLETVAIGMKVILNSYPNVIHQVVAIDSYGRRLTIREEFGDYVPQLEPELQNTVATIGFQAFGNYNSDSIEISNDTYVALKERLFVGQTISGADFDWPTRIVSIKHLEAHDRYKVYLSTKLKGFGYSLDDNSKTAVGYPAATRLFALGDQASNVLKNNEIGVILGVGWDHAQLAFYDRKISILPDPHEQRRVFTGWKAVAAMQKEAELLVVMDLGDKGIFRAPVILRDEELVLNPDEPIGIEKFNDVTNHFEPLTASDIDEIEFDGIETISTLSIVNDRGLIASDRGRGNTLTNTEIFDSYKSGVLARSVRGDKIGDGRALEPTKVFSKEDLNSLAEENLFEEEDFFEISSWAIPVPVIVQGDSKVRLDQQSLEIVRRMLEDWEEKERNSADVTYFDETRQVYDEFDQHGINVYGYGVKKGVTVRQVVKAGSAWYLEFSDEVFEGNAFGATTLSFGVGWYGKKPSGSEWVGDEALRIGDLVTSGLNAGKLPRPGQQLPAFTYVSEVGVDYLRVSNPIAGQRYAYNVSRYEGVEGFRSRATTVRVEQHPSELNKIYVEAETRNVPVDIAEGMRVRSQRPSGLIFSGRDVRVEGIQQVDRVVDGVPKPFLEITLSGSLDSFNALTPDARESVFFSFSREGTVAPAEIFFSNERYGNVVAANSSYGIELLRVAAASVQQPADTPINYAPFALSANTFGLIASNDQTLVSQNLRGPMSAEIFSAIYGSDDWGRVLAVEEIANLFSQRDQFGNKYAEENLEFVIELPDGDANSGERPTFWVR